MTIHNILFLCPDNAALSLMAEAYVATSKRGWANVYSAGSLPAQAVHPLALETLRAAGVRYFGLAPKSWHLFAGPGALDMDLIVSLCAPEDLGPEPDWPGNPHRMVLALSGAGSSAGLHRANMIDVFAEIRTLADSLLLDVEAATSDRAVA